MTKSVDEYLAGLPNDAREVFEDLRSIIRSAVPDATERISYRMPAVERDGRIVVWYAAFKEHCSVFPATEAVRNACGAELHPYLSGKGTIRFSIRDGIPAALVRRIVEARVAENAAASQT